MRALGFVAGVALCAASAVAAYPVVSMALWVPGVALCVAAWRPAGP